MADLVGTRELARRVGISAPAVSRAVREGRILPAASKNGRPLFDVEDAMKVWAAVAAPPQSPQQDEEAAPVPGAATDNVRYAKARADKEEALAQQEILELGRQRKELLPRGEVLMTFTMFLRAANQGVAGLPAKLLSRYPGLTPAGRQFLADELRTILDDLSRWRPDT